MPFSSPHGKKLIAEWLKSHDGNFEIAMDYGAGAGNYGKLLSEHAPKARRIGVEIFWPYIEKYELKKIYNEIILSDARSVAPPVGSLSIFGDILEHMPKIDAVNLIEQAVRNSKFIIACVPVGEYKQGACYGNEYEAHVAMWSYEELCDLFKNFAVRQNFGDVAVFINHA